MNSNSSNYQIRGEHRVIIRISALLSLLGAASFLLLGASASASTVRATTTKQSPVATVIAKSKAAMLHQSSVHYAVAGSDSKTKQSYDVTADLGTTSGSQSLQAGAASAYIRVTKSSAYIAGNATGLSDFFGMPATDVTKVGTKWVVIKKGTSQYTSLKESSTLPEIAAVLFPSPKVATLSSGSYEGEKSYILSWKLKSNGSTSNLQLYISKTGRGLPTYAIEHDGTETQKIFMTKWNESISVSAPSSTISLAAAGG